MHSLNAEVFAATYYQTHITQHISIFKPMITHHKVHAIEDTTPTSNLLRAFLPYQSILSIRNIPFRLYRSPLSFCDSNTSNISRVGYHIDDPHAMYLCLSIQLEE